MSKTMSDNDKFFFTVAVAMTFVLGFFIGILAASSMSKEEAVKAGAAVMVPNHKTQKFEFHWLSGGTNLVRE